MRTTNGTEVDVVFGAGRTVTPVEIKSAMPYHDAYAKFIRQLCGGMEGMVDPTVISKFCPAPHKRGRGEECAGLPVWDVPEGGRCPDGRVPVRPTHSAYRSPPAAGRTPEKTMNEDPTATPVSDNETPPGATPAPETPADATAPAADCAAFPKARFWKRHRDPVALLSFPFQPDCNPPRGGPFEQKRPMFGIKSRAFGQWGWRGNGRGGGSRGALTLPGDRAPRGPHSSEGKRVGGGRKVATG